MFSFIALAWDPLVEDQRSVAANFRSHLSNFVGWKLVFQSSQLAVFCAGTSNSSSPLLLPNKQGVILGTLFSKRADSSNRLQQLNDRAGAALAETRGKRLLTDHWGRYVAFLANADGSVSVIRDPTGELDCFFASLENVRVFFSSAAHCPFLKNAKLTVNWDYVISAAGTYLPETRETGLCEINRVLRGEHVIFRGPIFRRTFHWDPSAFTMEAKPDDIDLAAKMLRIATQSCINSWASVYGGILQLISGGLDSSIVLGLSAQVSPQPRMTSLTYYYLDGSGSDERNYARESAKHAGVPLLEEWVNPTFSLRRLSDMPAQVAPCNFVAQLAIDRIEERLASSVGAEVRFRGHGGDELFFSQGLLACADLLRNPRRYSSVPSFAMQIACREKRTIWSILSEAKLMSSVDSPSDIVRKRLQVSKLLTSESAELVKRNELFISPWLKDAAVEVPPGKAWQIAWLATGEGMYGPHAQLGDPEDLAPLCSQPILEVCLQIPSHVLMVGGSPRALARKAFRDVIPAAIVNRYSKGTPTEYTKAVIAANRDFISEALLDGQLVSNRILSRHDIEEAVQGISPRDRGFPTELFTLVSIEAWLQRWRGSEFRVTA